jgi:hypothetical protein
MLERPAYAATLTRHTHRLAEMVRSASVGQSFSKKPCDLGALLPPVAAE